MRLKTHTRYTTGKARKARVNARLLRPYLNPGQRKFTDVQNDHIHDTTDAKGPTQADDVQATPQSQPKMVQQSEIQHIIKATGPMSRRWYYIHWKDPTKANTWVLKEYVPVTAIQEFHRLKTMAGKVKKKRH